MESSSIGTAELLNLIVCPNCRGALESLAYCNHCGTSYWDDDGTPALFPIDAKRIVTFEFTQRRSVNGEEFRKCFTYPERRGPSVSGSPYHLDLAHIDILEQLPSNSTILEIGCGGGQMRNFLQSKGHRYVGVDISKTRIHEHLRQYGGPDILCDAHFLPFSDQKFDLVYSAAVTEHLACPYLVAQEVARTLKPGGFYLGNVSFLEPWHDDSFFHMTPLGVFELLTQANFEIKNIWPGEGYSGFRAILAMGNKITKPLTFVGDVLYSIYKFGNQLRKLKRQSDISSIADTAKVAGATDWIARRRFP